jgi:hypothetical protein
VIVISAMIDDGITEAALAAGASKFVLNRRQRACRGYQQAWTH